MNYLAHIEIAKRYTEQFPEHENPNFYTGVSGPDRLSIARCGLLRLKTWGQRAILSPEQIEIQNGVDFHIATDVALDENQQYLGLRRNFREEIAPDFISTKYRGTGMLADFGTDMLIDGYVIENHTDAVRLYCESIVDVDDFVLMSISKQRLEFLSSVNRTRGLVPDYTNPQVLAEILKNRVAGNPRLGIDDGSVFRLGLALGFHKENVYEAAEEIISDISTKLVGARID